MCSCFGSQQIKTLKLPSDQPHHIQEAFVEITASSFSGSQDGPFGHSKEPVVLVQLHEVLEGGERLEPAPVLSLRRLVPPRFICHLAMPIRET